MPIISGDGGRGIVIPSVTNSVPAGTRLEVDEFGELIVYGTNGNPGGLEVLEDTDPNAFSTLGSDIGLRVRGGDISLRDYATGAIIFTVSAAAYMTFLFNAAPADGVLNAGECALWFDSTNNAAKLMVKAKQADGTVKTASIALA